MADSSGVRRLASLERIVGVRPIPGADAIEVATVRGWEVVVRKGEHRAGEEVLFIEVDAALPLDDARFAFLAARGARVLDGRSVHVLKTARLRGVYSQGIVFGLEEFPEVRRAHDGHVDELLGIEKWEPPPPPGMDALGPFPSYLRKTDAERVQNLDEPTWAAIQADPEGWLATEKMDGSSLTAWRTADGVLRVAGRNWELDPATTNVYWEAAGDLEDLLRPGEWVQGEVLGPGVQANPLGLDKVELRIFGVGTFDVDSPTLATMSSLGRADWPGWASDLGVPVLDLALPATVADAVAQVDGLRSAVSAGQSVEGVVWTRRDGVGLPGLDGRPVWKVISPRYLIKHDG